MSALEPGANPFTTEPGHIPAAFGGRKTELRDARTMIDRVDSRRHGGQQVIEGLRGVGKTALMAGIRAIADERGVATVQMEVGTSASDVLVRRLMQRLVELAPGGRVRAHASRLRSVRIGPVTGELEPVDAGPPIVSDLVADLAAVAASEERGVLLTLDEVHENPGLTCEVVRGMHEAAQSGHPIAAYYAGLPGSHSALAEITTYAERLRVVELSVLDYDAVWVALTDPFRNHGIEVAPDVVDVVADETGGYPFFLQAWGYELWRATTDPDEVTMAAVHVARPNVQTMVSRLFEGRFRRLTDRQQDYLVALAKLGGSARSAEVAERLGLEPSSATRLRAELVDRGMTYAPSHGEIATTIPGLSAWLTERGSGRSRPG